jgi:hypothetical protein
LLNLTWVEAAPPDPAQTGFFEAPLDVLVLLDDGVPGRAGLTGMIDVTTRTVPAAVLCPDDVGRRERAAGPRAHARADAPQVRSSWHQDDLAVYRPGFG